MESAFSAFWKLGPAALLVKAIVAAIIADALLLGFILARRTYRGWFFAKRDARMLEIRRNWEGLISGAIPYETWRTRPFDRKIIETLVLDAFEVARPEESARLLKFLRASGLIEKYIFEARTHRGWRRQRSLVALGRIRAPEGIAALAEGLRDRDLETRLAALRGLERMACPEAATALLTWTAGSGLTVPALPLQCALIPCCAERPQVLLPYLKHAEGSLREVLARVLGEVATPSLRSELMQFVGDDLDELRAAAARALSQGEPRMAIEVLSELAKDRVWFVRLRAITSLGKLCHSDAIPALLGGITDSNRLVRLRAAEGLLDIRDGMALIFEKVVGTDDRYGLHAYLTVLDNSGLQPTLEKELERIRTGHENQVDQLLEVLRTGVLPAGRPAPEKAIPAKAAQ